MSGSDRESDDAALYPEPPAEGRELRKGWTTGACAAAATRAAAEALLTGRFPDLVTITLPRGHTPSFALVRREHSATSATAGVVKDAGDDPDVTHGALVLSTVERGAAGSGVTFRAGEGVGTVTRAGLPLAVGEPAINPAPRAQIRAALADAVRAAGGDPDALDFVVTVAIPGGAKLAERTLNGRLGIVGGLSVLGTSGIVVPYSCAAWIHSIHRGIDVARAAGLTHIAASTGSTSETAVKALYGFDDVALIDMGDFAGGTLKYLRNHAIPRLTIAGGFAKLAKLAAGELDLHSGRSQVDVAKLAALLRDLDAPAEMADRAAASASAGEVLQISAAAGIKLADAVAERARATALATLAGGIAVDVLVFDRQGALIGRAGP
jgi:cobalt-precorrin-5B (C1)-methyltransferase